MTAIAGPGATSISEPAFMSFRRARCKKFNLGMSSESGAVAALRERVCELTRSSPKLNEQHSAAAVPRALQCHVQGPDAQPHRVLHRSAGFASCNNLLLPIRWSGRERCVRHRCSAQRSAVYVAAALALAADAAVLVQPDTERAKCGLLAKRQRVAGGGKHAMVLTKFITRARTHARLPDAQYS